MTLTPNFNNSCPDCVFITSFGVRGKPTDFYMCTNPLTGITSLVAIVDDLIAEEEELSDDVSKAIAILMQQHIMPLTIDITSQ